MKIAKMEGNKYTIRFKTKLFEPNGTAKKGPWALIAFPKSASVKLPSQSMMVEGTINALPFRAALEPNNKGGHALKVSKAMQDALGADFTDAVTVEITRVGEEKETRMPIDLGKALAATPAARASWVDITPLARRDWIFSISTAKQLETRRRRIAKACDMLASGKRRLCCFPGIKWLMKKNARTCGMWLPLPNSKK